MTPTKYPAKTDESAIGISDAERIRSGNVHRPSAKTLFAKYGADDWTELTQTIEHYIAASKLFGVDVEKSGNTVTLKLGEGKVKFTEGQTAYDVNGEARTAERTVYSGGKLDIKTLCDVYGRVFREADNSYSILDKAESVEKYQSMIDRLVG